MNRIMMTGLLLTAVVFGESSAVVGQDSAEPPLWKAGTASAKITPERPLRMAGYARRTEPAAGTEQDLFAKCIAVEDQQGNRVVIITLDLIGVFAELRSAVVAQLTQQHNLPPQAILINASHTHCGPDYVHDDAKDYFDQLGQTLIRIVGESLNRLEPARLFYSFLRASVAMNRRTPSATGFINHPNPHGTVDHSVPVLSVRGTTGELRAIVFGYACHNTTIGFRKWLGDYGATPKSFWKPIIRA